MAYSKRLRIEHLECRAMLSASADIVFLFDESGSSMNEETTHGFAETLPWLKENIEEIDTALRLQGVTDLRYGLVSYGGIELSGYGHSFLVDAGNGSASDRLFSESTAGNPAARATEHVIEIGTAFTNIHPDRSAPSLEDGWDAIEHAVSEYDFRDGAVPIFVLIQSDEGLVRTNNSLTREGTLASMSSSNVILNVLVPGQASNMSGDDPTYFDLFSIDTLASNERVLGVEADTDGDGFHSAYTHVDATSTRSTATFNDNTGSLDDIIGEEADANNSDIDGNTALGETENSYVRLAWNTGGAAWDVGIIDSVSEDFDPNPFTPAELLEQAQREIALRAAFAESLAEQILAADTEGRVFHEDQVLLALNIGSSSDLDAGNAGVFRADNGDFTLDGGESTVDSFVVTNAIEIDKTNSIPAGDVTALEGVFQSTRGEQINDSNLENISLTIHAIDTGGTPTTLLDGSYVVELFFAELDSAFDRFFDVVLEGETVLSSYDIHGDYARVSSYGNTNPPTELATQQLQTNSGVVKRFQVDVTGGDGLQIELLADSFNSFSDPLLSGVRILSTETDAPRVTNVIFIGQQDTTIIEISMDEKIEAEEQLNNIGIGSVNEVRIEFDQPVTVVLNDLDIYPLIGGSFATKPVVASLAVAADQRSATWTLQNDLPSNLFGLRLEDSVVNASGLALDGEWINPTNTNMASGPTGSPATELTSGDGVAGQDFVFVFTSLRSDFNNDDSVDFLDLDILGTYFGQNTSLGDANGDGVVDLLDLGALGSDFGFAWIDLAMLLESVDLNNDGTINQLDLDAFINDPNSDLDGDGDWDTIDEAIFALFADLQVA